MGQLMTLYEEVNISRPSFVISSVLGLFSFNFMVIHILDGIEKILICTKSVSCFWMIVDFEYYNLMSSKLIFNIINRNAFC